MRKSLSLLLAGGLAVAPGAAAESPAGAPSEADLLQGKCILCHSAMRVYTMDPAKLKETVERMAAKNPEWFKDVSSRHVVEALSSILKDPNIAAQRASWEEAVARGKALYADRSLGTAGKACIDCHPAGSLARVEEKYPKYDEKLNRYESLEERLATMIVTKLGGAPPFAGDPRITDLGIYLTSLR